MSSEISVRFNEKNKDISPAVFDLFKASFNRDSNKEYWKWRFLNPALQNKIENALSVCAYAGQQLVGHYGLTPLEIKMGTGTRKVCMVSMLMTHPDFSGKGIFRQMGLKADEYLKSKGMDGCIAFVNHNSHYGFIKNLGWSNCRIMTTMSLSRKASSAKPGEDHERFSQKHADKFGFWGQKKTSCHFSKGSDYLQWRLGQNPLNTYRVYEDSNQAVIYKSSQWGIDILELFQNPSVTQTPSGTAEFIHSLSEETGGPVNLFCSLHSPLHLELEKKGFQEKEFNSYFIYKFFDEDRAATGMQELEISMIDSDIF